MFLSLNVLAQTYIRRWPVQENIIRDFLLPLGLDTNHGYYYSCRCGKIRGEKEKEARSTSYQRAAVARERARGSRNAVGKRL
jgi:hypothetical protein